MEKIVGTDRHFLSIREVEEFSNRAKMGCSSDYTNKDKWVTVTTILNSCQKIFKQRECARQVMKLRFE